MKIPKVEIYKSLCSKVIGLITCWFVFLMSGHAVFSIGHTPDSQKVGINKMYADETKQQLVAYLNADEKYFVSPLPVHLIKKDVADIVFGELNKGARGSKLERISKLVAFYGLNEMAVPLDKILTSSTKPPLALLDIVIIIKSIKWIGDRTKQETASKVLIQTMQRNLADESNRMLLLDVYMDWGSSLNIKPFIDWLELGRIKYEVQLLAAEKIDDEVAAEIAEINIEDLNYFKDREVRLLEHNNKTRETISSLPTEKRIQQLTKFYLIDTEGSSKQLSFWSAVLLARLAEQSSENTKWIVDEFIKLSNDFHTPLYTGNTEGGTGENDAKFFPFEAPFVSAESNKKDVDGPDENTFEESSQAEADLIRATCLRAAIFFGAVLIESDQSWLKEQLDEGTDILHKRPGWKYVEHKH